MRRQLYPLLIFIMLLAVSGCVRLASEETAPQVGAAQTFTPIPTETNTPPFTQTPTETVISPTDPGAQTITDTPIPVPTETATVTPTPTEAQSGLVQETLVAQDDAPPLGEGEGTGADPNAGQVPDLQLSATALIQNATATQSFLLTQAAQESIGETVPTATPVPQDTGGDSGLGSGTDDGGGGGSTVVQPGADCIHEVRPQDQNLYRLSIAYGVSVQQIAQASGIVNPDLIRVGQRLTVPGCGTTGGVPPATSTPRPGGDSNTGTLPGSGSSGSVGGLTPCGVNTTVQFPNGCPDTSRNPNASGNLGTGTGTDGSTVSGSAGGVTHTVAQNETLFQISLQYGVPITQIAAANGITNYDNIRFNQQLVIP